MFFVTFGFLLILLMQIEISFCVLGGEIASQKNYPAQALMMVNHLVDGNRPIFCGATVLDANHILTAASCVVFNNELISPSEVLVQAGSNIFLQEKATQRVSAIFIHNNFDPVSLKNDIAVIRMEKEKFDDYNTDILKSATLQKESVQDKTSCRITGFYLPSTEPIARFLDVSIQDRTTCNSASIYDGKIFNQMLCAGLANPTSDKEGVCPSDRGGGLYCGERLTGVLSFGLDCAKVEKQKPGVYTEVRWYLDWIEQRLNDKSTPEAGPIRPSTAAAMPLTFSMSLLFGILLINCLNSV